ncbi:MAG: hypothetical protein FD189_238 [Elusimicrobia bacterium]|nr:MAG: hypothetical protein FD154_38 [Elusimicrobiota bacterium]KAF0157971.1 MAG: hypothetical protein FD189_238 [Elusimicrobiota bacterium]
MAELDAAGFDRLLAYRVFLTGFFVWWGWGIAANDLRSRKIPNRMVLTGLYAAFATLSLFLLETLLGDAGQSGDYLLWNFYGYYLVSLALAVGVGFFLWYGEVWPAGDAKFFIASLALLPLIDFQIRGFPRSLWLSILVNSFVIGAVYYVFRFLSRAYRGYKHRDEELLLKIEGIRRDLAAGFRSFFDGGYGKSFLYAVSLFFIFFLYQVASVSFKGHLQRLVPDLSLLFFLLFIGWEKVSGFLSGPRLRLALGLLFVSYFAYGFVNFRSELLQGARYAALNVVKFSVILAVGRFLLVSLMEKFSTVEVPVSEIAPGMVLSRRYIDIVKKDEFFKDEFADSFRDGMTPEEAELLRRWGARIPRENPKIEVMEGAPFALWIFSGCLFQLVFSGNVFTFLKRFAGLD